MGHAQMVFVKQPNCSFMCVKNDLCLGEVWSHHRRQLRQLEERKKMELPPPPYIVCLRSPIPRVLWPSYGAANRMPSACVSACERNRETCLDVQAEGMGFYMRETETDSAGGSIPGGIQTASVLCDRDGDDFIRPDSSSLSPLCLCLSVAVNRAVRVIYCMSSNLTCQIVAICRTDNMSSVHLSFLKRQRTNPNQIQPISIMMQHPKCQKVI